MTLDGSTVHALKGRASSSRRVHQLPMRHRERGKARGWDVSRDPCRPGGRRLRVPSGLRGAARRVKSLAALGSRASENRHGSPGSSQSSTLQAILARRPKSSGTTGISRGASQRVAPPPESGVGRIPNSRGITACGGATSECAELRRSRANAARRIRWRLWDARGSQRRGERSFRQSA